MPKTFLKPIGSTVDIVWILIETSAKEEREIVQNPTTVAADMERVPRDRENNNTL